MTEKTIYSQSVDEILEFFGYPAIDGEVKYDEEGGWVLFIPLVGGCITNHNGTTPYTFIDYSD